MVKIEFEFFGFLPITFFNYGVIVMGLIHMENIFNKINKIITVLIGLCVVNTTVYAVDENSPLRFGSVAMDIPAVMHKRLTPLTEYLSQELNRPVILTLSPNMGAAIDAVATDKVDFAYLTPVAYLKSHDKGATRIIARTLTNKKPFFQLMIVVREDSPIKSVQDLAGKSFAFGDKRALLQRAVVVGSGIKLKDFSKYDFIGHYDNIVRGVLNRDYDAGILKDTKAFKWEKKGIRILYASPELPPYNITASKTVSHNLFNKVQKSFTNLDVNNPKHLPVIKALSQKYDGFVATTDDDYNVVRKLIKPFSK